MSRMPGWYQTSTPRIPRKSAIRHRHVRLVERTNNDLESLFHTIKHGERRRSGRKFLTHDFEVLPPAATLAANLRDPDYVGIVCGSLASLAPAFAELHPANRSLSIAAAMYRPPLSRPHRSARWINGSSASTLSAIASRLQLSASNLSQPVRFHDKSLRQPTFDAEGEACYNSTNWELSVECHPVRQDLNITRT